MIICATAHNQTIHDKANPKLVNKNANEQHKPGYFSICHLILPDTRL